MVAGMKTQLILLPGTLNDEELWRAQVTGLSDLADCVVADLSTGETLMELAENVLATARPSFALAGFSLGGFVALEIARLAPSRIERLALLDTSMRADTPKRVAERQALDRAARASGTFVGISRRMLAEFVHPDRLDDTDLTLRIQEMTRRLGRDVFLRQNAIVRTGGEQALRDLRCPVLILCGAQDAIAPLKLHQEMAAAAPQAKLVIIEGSGHMTPMEKPDEVTAAMRNWLIEAG
jgi:pimeloyl-ACP methyl ester carboxylesterase